MTKTKRDEIISPRYGAVSSEARKRLADLIDQKRSTEARLRQLSEQMGRLQSAIDREHTARGRLQASDAVQADEMAAWSRGHRGDDDPPPVFDTKSRAALELVLEQATVAAAAARSAIELVTTQQGILSTDLRQISRKIEFAAALVMIEATVPMIEEFEDATRSLLIQSARIDRAVQFIANRSRTIGGLDTKNVDFEAVRPILNALTELNIRVGGTKGQLAQDVSSIHQFSPAHFGAHDAEWASFAAELENNPTAQFKG